MDITSLSIQESTVLHLEHPATGDKLYVNDKDQLTFTATDKPVTITVASKASRPYREFTTAMANRRLKREQAAVKQRKEAQPLTVEEIRADGIELLTVCCLDSDNLTYNGEAVKTADDFRALLADPKMDWIKDQVDATVASVDLFIEGSLTH